MELRNTNTNPNSVHRSTNKRRGFVVGNAESFSLESGSVLCVNKSALLAELHLESVFLHEW
jgi:hypothetical protein